LLKPQLHRVVFRSREKYEINHISLPKLRRVRSQLSFWNTLRLKLHFYKFLYMNRLMEVSLGREMLVCSCPIAL